MMGRKHFSMEKKKHHKDEGVLNCRCHCGLCHGSGTDFPFWFCKTFHFRKYWCFQERVFQQISCSRPRKPYCSILNCSLLSFINCFMRKELCSNASRPKKRHHLHALRDLIHVWNILWSTPSPKKTETTFIPRILLPQRQRRQRCRSVGSTPVPPSTSTSSSLPTSRTPSSPSPPTKTPSRRPQTISSIQKCEKPNHNKKKTFKRKADVAQNAFSHNYKIKKCFTSSSVWLSFSNMLDIFPNSCQS